MLKEGFMDSGHTRRWDQWEFLGGLTLGGAVGLLGLRPRPVSAELALEVTTLRLMEAPALYFAPEYVAGELLPSEALRFHEVGMIKSSPQKLIAQGTDWRFLNELKRELKG
jgi:hypothetical protein